MPFFNEFAHLLNRCVGFLPNKIMTRSIQNIDSSAINSVPQIFAIFQGAEFIFRSAQ